MSSEEDLAMPAEITLRERVVYHVDKMLSGNDRGRLLFLALVAGSLVVFLGTLRTVVAEVPWAAGVLWADAVTLDPGFGDEETPALVGVAALTSITGLCVVAVLIGLVNTSIEQRLELLRRGRSRVIAADHTIILGFNAEKVLAILRELNTAAQERSARGHWSRKMSVVVLSNEEKQAVEEQVLRPELGLVDVIVRCGNPCSVAQLFNAGAERASCVIVLNNEDNGDISIVKTLLALRKIPNPNFHVVAELSKAETGSILPSIFPGAGRLAPIVMVSISHVA